MLLEKDQILKFIPHRDPFLFIDSVESVEYTQEITEGVYDPKKVVGAKVVANYHVPEKLEIFKGHFPGNPILPGVIQSEMTAQASTFALLRIVPNPDDVKLNVALLNISSAKFRKPIRPGMDLTIEVECTRVRGTMMSYDGRIKVGNDVMSETSFMATVSLAD